MLKIALIREEKQPADARVALTPKQCKALLDEGTDLEITVQPSSVRCFPDEEYVNAGCKLSEDLADIPFLFGVKEVPKEFLIADKTYFYFSHTIKMQPYNRGMLQEILKKNIRLVDYECLTWENGARIIGFGRHAGIVGMHNGLLGYGLKTKSFELPRAFERTDFTDLIKTYEGIQIPPIKIAICGDGRVAHGAMELLEAVGVKAVSPEQFCVANDSEPLYVQLRPRELYRRSDGSEFTREHFFSQPKDFKSVFSKYYPCADLMVNAIYWTEDIPVHFTLDEMKSEQFRIKVISDVTCDIHGSVPSTIRDTPISDPVYGWDAQEEKEVEAYQKHTIDMMTVSNLPCELPRDASKTFGEALTEHVIPRLLVDGEVLQRATIAQHGSLTAEYSYLQDYVDGN